MHKKIDKFNINKIVALASLTSIIAITAMACGPDFKLLLPIRDTVLKSPPVVIFSYEAAHLLDVPESTFKVPTVKAAARASLSNAEQDLKNQIQSNLIQEARSAADGRRAYALGKALPEAVRLYQAGAVDFKRHDLESAKKWFEAVLAQPNDEDKPQKLLAAFMMGRVTLLQFLDNHQNAQSSEADATRYFELTRKLVGEGVPDPDALALASYGEQARLHIVNAGFPNEDAVLHKEAVDETLQATRLYAQQAVNGSQSGIWSLLEVADWIMQDQSRLQAVIHDPLMQKTLSAFVVSHDFNRYDDVAINPSSQKADADLLSRLLQAGKQANVTHFAGAGNLAVLAYRAGRYDEASYFADQEKSYRSAWVNAKLALQRGDFEASAKGYAEAIARMPHFQNEWDEVSAGVTNIKDEYAVLNVSRGEFVQAFLILMKTSWIDASYLAERVLSTNELVDIVNQYAPFKGLEPASKTNVIDSNSPNNVTSKLRNLLARRLMREARYQEALTYFNDVQDDNGGVKPLSGWAKDYMQADERASSVQGSVKAGYLFQQASIMRRRGLELFGYEAAPDYAFVDGNFDLSVSFMPEKATAYVHESEKQRFSTSLPTIDRRYHYRYRAVALAEESAALMPPKSQAYAAVLCAATGWMLETSSPESQKKASALYKQYIKNGKSFSWAANFGHDCPAPDVVDTH